ncbi:hypothetical protein E4U55_006202 [Claviceps digitariae]|nr:hypothetical protein E4U55_006202 [Claviceps digitariae]
MKVSAVASVAMAGLVSAQSISDIPACAMPCLSTAVTSKTTCALTDIACLCEKANFVAVQAAATSCVLEKCGASKALSEVLPATQKLCAAFSNGGGSPSPPPPASTPTPSDDGDDDDDDGTKPSPTTPGAHPEPSCDDDGHAGAAGNDEPTAVPMPIPGNNDTAPAPAPVPTTPVTAGAAGLAPMGALAVLVLGALAL